MHSLMQCIETMCFTRRNRVTLNRKSLAYTNNKHSNRPVNCSSKYLLNHEGETLLWIPRPKQLSLHGSGARPSFTGMIKHLIQLSLRMRKPTICICENKGADQLRSNCEAISFAVTAKLISAFVFATWIVQFLYFQNPKCPASNHLL